MTGRKTITVDEPVFDRLAEAKPADASWSEYLSNLADGTVNDVNTVAVENVDEIARQTASEVENRMTRR